MRNVIRRASRAKRNTKGRRVQRRKNRRIVQRAVDAMKQRILESDEYQEFIEDLRDFELTDAEPIIINVNGTNVRIVPRPEATPMLYGFKIYYTVGRGRPVFIEEVSTGAPVQDAMYGSIGA